MKTMWAMTKKAFLVLSLGLSTVAAADVYSPVTESLTGGEFQIAPGQIQTVTLRNWRYVQKIFVRAEAYYSNSNATVEVIANGDVKGTIYLPGRDPSYVVTIGETVRSLQFRNVSNSWARIIDVQGVMAQNPLPTVPPVVLPGNCEPFQLCPGAVVPPTSPYLPARNQGAYLSSRAITLVDGLEAHANYAEYGVYLLPIKKVAARAYATTANYGDLSLVSRGALLALKQQIEFATPYLDQTFERDAAFQLAVELTSLGKSLEALLR